MVTASKFDTDYDTLKDHILARLDEFIIACYEAGYDAIIPIEGEGAALLAPFLFLARYSNHPHPEIIPSDSRLTFLNEDYFSKKSLKHVLVLDVSIRSGYTLRSVKDQVKERFGIEATGAAFLVRSDYDDKDNLALKEKAIFLPVLEYEWARDIIIEYLFNNVFVNCGDPPLWQFKFEEARRSQIVHSLLQLGSTYVVPYEFGDWTRITISNILLEDTSWLPDGVETDTPHKIRVLIHNEESRIRVLPLFFPKVYANNNIPVSEGNDYYNLLKNEDLSTVIKAPQIYVWIAQQGSKLLLHDFVQRMKTSSRGVAWDNPELTIPPIDLFRFAQPIKLSKNFETSVSMMLKDSMRQESQLQLPTFAFRFDKSEQVDFPSAYTVCGKLRGFSPEEACVVVIGKWIEKVLNESEEPEKLLDIGLTIHELWNLAKCIPKFGIERAIDVLVDEGFLNPKISEVSGYIVRTYGIGGESNRRRFLAWSVLDSD